MDTNESAPATGIRPVPGPTGLDVAAALAWIWSLPRYPPHPSPPRVARHLATMGDPHRRYPAVHVTGTNGKGSTAATLAAIARAAGKRVGLYTSPHLARANERIRVDDEEIPDADLARIAARVRAIVESASDPALVPAAFDVFTLVAFQWFAERHIDLAVVEVGVGGRLDATNVIDAPVVVLTNVDLEHTEVLGGTRAAIAREKAALARPGGTVVTADASPEVRDAVAATGARLLAVDAGKGTPAATVRVSTLDGTRLDYTGARWSFTDLATPLLGAHQVANVGCALAAAEELVARGMLPDEPEAARRGVAARRWPGRLEIVHRDPLVIVDAAHNPHGVRALAASLAPLVAGRQRTLVLGVSESKPYREMVPLLLALADEVIVTRADYHGLATDALADVVRACGREPVAVHASVADAVRDAVARAPRDGVVLALGGLFLAAEARAAFDGA